MEVTRHNFHEALADIEKQLSMPSCRFAAIDTEFTGLTPNEKTREKVIDLLEERYNKVRQSGESFLITQFGLALVHVEDTSTNASASKTWISCWNFYIFPRPYHNIDYRFLCQASSMQFMAEHGFDFNKFIRDGIPYLSRTNEERARKNNEKNIKNVGKTPPQSLSIKNEQDKVRKQPWVHSMRVYVHKVV
jgi:poly(A)-specific ribonuclease